MRVIDHPKPKLQMRPQTEFDIQPQVTDVSRETAGLVPHLAAHRHAGAAYRRPIAKPPRSAEYFIVVFRLAGEDVLEPPVLPEHDPRMPDRVVARVQQFSADQSHTRILQRSGQFLQPAGAGWSH